MAGRPEFLSVLGRVRFSLSNGNFPSLNFKPLQVKCFESVLKGQNIILRFHCHAINTAQKNTSETVQWKKPRK